MKEYTEKIDSISAAKQLEIVKQSKLDIKRLNARNTGKYLIMWGMVWALGYLFTHLYVYNSPLEIRQKFGNNGIFFIWTFLLFIAGVLQGIMVSYDSKNMPVTPKKKSNSTANTLVLWAMVLVIALLAVFFFKPQSGIAINAFMVVSIMSIYIIWGIQLSDIFLLSSGITIILTTITGYLAIEPEYYNIWMMLAAGLVLAGFGVAARIYGGKLE
ncbi:MAG: hypothetical protein FVQ82_04215 [Planctomycetes bacterium]|nr:hypothetical protein [Planctomycetota bacterium]